jgi:DNA-binding response OmpR family regulator
MKLTHESIPPSTMDTIAPVKTTKPRSENLLIVDDDEVNRDLMSRRFHRAGYYVYTAADAEEALNCMQKSRIDLILLDLMMPRRSGMELLKLLRGKYTPLQLPVIMVSALNESSQIVLALTFGANDYITKPIDFSVAIARIRTQLLRKKSDQAVLESKDAK